MNERKQMGREVDGVIIPIATDIEEFGDGYKEFIESIKENIKSQHARVLLQANKEIICLYWRLGNVITRKQVEEGWGTKVIDRISHDLRQAFPEIKGFSPRNIKYMKKFSNIWQDESIMQQVVALLPWGSNIVLMEKLSTEEERIWYAQKTLEYGWSRNVLNFQIESKLYSRTGKSTNNFQVALPPNDSDMANQVFKDPYLFDFLGNDLPRRELDLEKKLTEHIQDFLLELGQGFAFVGRQVHLEVGGEDFYIDLLFYHLKLRCFIVIELKACEFEPGFVSQLNMYQNIVNSVLKHHDDNPTIGLLLVKGKNKTVVEYSLTGYNNPIGVADWQHQLSNQIDDNIQSSLPTIEQIERELEFGGEPA